MYGVDKIFLTARLSTDKIQLLKTAFTEQAHKSRAGGAGGGHHFGNCVILKLQTVADRNNPPVSTDIPRDFIVNEASCNVSMLEIVSASMDFTYRPSEEGSALLPRLNEMRRTVMTGICAR